MRRILPWLAAVMLPLAARADSDAVILYVTQCGTGAVTRAATNAGPLRGYVDSIEFDAISAATTANVTVITVPYYSTKTGVTLFSTNGLSKDLGPLYVRFGCVTSAGANTSDQPSERYPLAGERIIFRTTACGLTNKPMRCIVRVERD